MCFVLSKSTFFNLQTYILQPIFWSKICDQASVCLFIRVFLSLKNCVNVSASKQLYISLRSSIILCPREFCLSLHYLALPNTILHCSALLSTPGPRLVRFSLVRFSLVRFSLMRCFKTLPKYLTHADYSFTHAFYI